MEYFLHKKWNIFWIVGGKELPLRYQFNTMARKLIDYGEFLEIVGKKELDSYTNCVINGFNDQLELIKFNATLDCYVDLEISTKAKFTHNRISGRLIETFKNHPTIKVDTIRQIVMFNASDKVLIRHKKFKTNKKISSYNTESHKAFMRQEGLIDDPTFIVGGYMLNKANTEMLGVYFACYSANGLEWHAKYGEYVSEQQSIDFNTPLTKPMERKLTEVKKKLTNLKIVKGGSELKSINDRTGA